MRKYNLFYKTGNKIVDKKNIAGKEVYDFIKELQKEDESELRVSQVKEREDVER